MRQKRHFNEKLGNRLRFYSEIRKALEVFGKIDYSVITGGYVQNESKLGDVDIITVLPYISINSRNEVINFAKKHVSAQINNRFSPDYQFPTDIITRQQINDAVSGRALELVNGKLKLKKYSKDEVSTMPEADYRVWLFEMITHDFDLVGGSFEHLVRDTIQAHKTIFLLLCSMIGYPEKISIEWLRREIFSIADSDASDCPTSAHE